MNFKQIAAAVMAASASITAQFGSPNGRQANIQQAAQTSVEASFTFGDYQFLGARLNYKLSNDLMVFADVGQGELEVEELRSELSNPDGIVFGFGAFHQLAGVSQTMDVAVKASVHLGTLELTSDGVKVETDIENFSVEGLFSGRNSIGTSGNLYPYGNLGIHRLRGEVEAQGRRISEDSETELGFGGGVVMKTATGEFYGGVDLIDEILFGFGFRYNL